MTAADHCMTDVVPLSAQRADGVTLACSRVYSSQGAGWARPYRDSPPRAGRS